MSRKSINRNILEEKMKNHPETKAHLMLTSPFRKHRKEAAAMTKRLADAVANAKKAVSEVEMNESSDPTEA